jgi:hypothetical protein
MLHAIHVQERELETIRKQYLGGVRNTKRVVKAADKFKAVFQFDWDATGTLHYTLPKHAKK